MLLLGHTYGSLHWIWQYISTQSNREMDFRGKHGDRHRIFLRSNSYGIYGFDNYQRGRQARQVPYYQTKFRRSKVPKIWFQSEMQLSNLVNQHLRRGLIFYQTMFFLRSIFCLFANNQKNIGKRLLGPTKAFRTDYTSISF